MSQLQLIPIRQPLVCAFGLGVDSMAYIIEFKRRGIRPDLILFADTRGEKPETYAYLEVAQEYVRNAGFPAIEVVTVVCLTNETLPSLAFGMKSCSLKWKVGPQNKFCNNWAPARETWAAGLKVLKVIGYDASPRDSCRGTFAGDGRGKGLCVCCRKSPCPKYEYWYPLTEWGFDRAACIETIRSEGLPVPVKSACFFCPASKKDEIRELAVTHPQLAARAIAIEDNWLHGRHEKKSTAGLGRRFTWRSEIEKGVI